MGAFKDLTGMKFGRLTVTKRVEDHITIGGQRQPQWFCICDCGTKLVVTGASLRSNNTKSCGCLKRDSIITFNKITKRKQNKYNLSGEYGIGYTSKGEEFYFDLEDYDKIKDYCWMVNSRDYITCSISGEKDILMHRVITDCPEKMEVDHKNGRKTRNDNRKDNLRVCTHQQNLCNYATPINNTSGHKGVTYNRRSNMWQSNITYKGKRIHLGYFIDKNEAVKARQIAELQYFGEYKYDPKPIEI